MASNWIRGKAERPEKRRIVLIYETGDAKNDDLEQLLERIPYGQGNRMLLECLRAGAKAMLSQADGVRSKAPPSPAPASAPQQAETSPVTSTNNGQAYSKAATRMFEGGAA